MSDTIYMEGIIYRAYDSKGKSYIGQTKRKLELRIKGHYNKIYDGSKFHNELLINDLDFTWEILENNIPEDKLLEREKYWVQVFDSQNNGYNGKVINCYIMNEDIKVKISNSLKGRTFSSEHREHISYSLKGKKLSDETKNKLKIARKGRQPNLGKTTSEQTKEKIRSRVTGKNNGMYGKPGATKGKHRIYREDGTYYYN